MPDYWDWLIEFWHWIAKDSISFFTFVLAIVAGLQGYLIWRQIRLAREEFDASHRPQLEVRFVRELANGIEITVINTGTGTGRFVEARAGIWHLLPGEQFPSPHDLKPGNSFKLRKTFAPSASDRYTIKNVVDEFAGGFGSPAHVFGWIVYETMAPTPVRRTTYFGRRSEPLVPELVPVEGSDWNFIQ